MKALLRLVAVIVALLPAAAGAVVIGQTDTFQDGTTDGWFAGGGPNGALPPLPPIVVANGGPSGAGDAFLDITALGGSGPGSRLVANNTTQWAGDYLAAGVGSISMDLRNLGATDLTIRLLLEDPMNGPPVDEAVTSFGAVLPAGGGWTHVVFSISAADLTVLSGSANDLLSAVTLLRIIDSLTASEAIPVVGVLGVDNITAGGALAVPEPTSVALLGTGILVLGLTRRRRRGGVVKNRVWRLVVCRRAGVRAIASVNIAQLRQAHRAGARPPP